MKHSLLLMASLLLISAVGAAASQKSDAGAKQKKSAVAKKLTASRVNQAQLGTSFRFDGSSLHGKFQSAPSTVATVENDKYLEDLLGARRNFKDRAKQDSERN